MKKVIKLLIVLGAIFFLTGCTSYTELNDLGIVNMLGIDYKDDEFHVYLNVIEGKQDDGVLEKEAVHYESSAKTLEEAFEKIYRKSNKKIYVSHIDLLIITEDLVNNKLKEALNIFLTNSEYRNNFSIALLKDNIGLLFESNIESEEITKLIDINNKETGTSHNIDFETFLKNLLIDTNSYLPSIYYDEVLGIDGTCLIKNYQVYSYLNHEESILFYILMNKVSKGLFHSINIYENETTIKISHNKVKITVKSLIDKNDEKYEKLMKEELENLLNRYKEDNYDLIQIENKIKQDHYFYYKETKDLLSKVKFSISVKASIKKNYIERSEIYE